MAYALRLPVDPLPPWLFFAVVLPVCASLVGCTPAIGDKCTLSTDCSVQGTRVCDTSQAGGYCTVLGCTADSCPDNASCVEFGASVPGCPYDDYHAPSRTGRAMCMKGCGSDSDCRQGDGYVCRDPRQSPWGAVLIDGDRSHKVCLVAPLSSSSSNSADAADDAAVCSYARPPVSDATVGDAPSVDGTTESGSTSETGADAPVESSSGEGAADVAAEDAMSADVEGSAEGGADAGSFDASDGG